MRIAKYYDRFCFKREALWSTTDTSNLTAKQIFDRMPWDEDGWDDAGLKDLFLYLRGAKGLELGEWRPYFPTNI
jgi:hypothetical protein